MTIPKICHCDAVRMDSDAIEGLEEGFQRLRLAPAATPLKTFLTKRAFQLLQYLTTPLGGNLYDVLRLGMLHHDARIGATACDQYAYDIFSVILDPLIEARHFGFELDDVHPPDDWGYNRLSQFQKLDPDNEFIISTRVRCSRNLDGYRFVPTMRPEELQEVEKLTVEILYMLPWQYSGRYLPIQCIPIHTRELLARQHCFFDEPDKYEQTANIRNHWPIGRGVFVNEQRTFVVLINDKDHIRVIGMEKGENIVDAYKRVASATPVLDRRLIPAVHERLGYLTVCPGDVGTALRISVLMKIPKTMPHCSLERVAKVYRLEIKCPGEIEEDTDDDVNVWCVSNLRSIGVTQIDVLKDFHHGLRELLMVVSFHASRRKKSKKKGYCSDTKGEDDDSEDSSGREEDVVEEKKKEPADIYDLEAKYTRTVKETIREANRRQIAKMCVKRDREYPPAKDRLFPETKKAEDDATAPKDVEVKKVDPYTRKKININDRRTLKHERCCRLIECVCTKKTYTL